MRTVLLASLKHNRRRYVASALAVVLGVAFIVAVNGMAGSLRSGMTADVAAPYAGVDQVVDVYDAHLADEVVEAAEAAGGQAHVEWNGWSDVKVGSNTISDTFFVTVSPYPEQQWQQLSEGRHASADGEVMVAATTAIANDISVGDEVSFGAGRNTVTAEVVGIVDGSGFGSGSFYVRPADAEASGALWVKAVHVQGGLPGTLEADLDEGVSIHAVDDYVNDLQMTMTQGVDIIAMMISLFGAIALMVATLVIANTFAILFAQRAKDFALLRCVGVTKRQLRRSVRIEALVLGLVASLIGALVGVAVAYGLIALASIKFDTLGPVSFSPLWVSAAVIIGILVTVVAAWLPTRAVTKISPLAALRPTEGVDAASRAGILRTAAGLLLAGGGAAALGVVVALTRADEGPDETLLLFGMLAGGAVSFVGVLLLGPFLVPALVKLLGRVAALLPGQRTEARLASSNAARNPKRTATTAASLMIGVTLTVAVLTGLSSVRAVLNAEMEQSYPLDLTVALDPAAGAQDAEITDELVEAIADAAGVTDAAAAHGGSVTIDGAEIPVIAVDGDEEVLRVPNAELWDDEAPLLVPFELGQSFAGAITQDEETWTQHLTVRTADGPREVEMSYSDSYGASTIAMAPATLTELTGTAAGDFEPVAVWVKVKNGTDPDDVLTEITKAATAVGVAVEVSGDYPTRHFSNQQFNVISGAVVGLLSVAIIIALIGIGNTLGLSVLERSKENSLLRAMGLTTRQMRRTLAWEGILLALAATVLGVAIGLAFAWVGVQVMLGQLPIITTFTVPYGQIAIVIVVAVVAGVLASVLPSRRASRVSPAEGLSLQ